jgi:hypothetical protein
VALPPPPSNVNVDVPPLRLSHRVIITALVLGGALQVTFDELHPVDASATTGHLVRRFAIPTGPDVQVQLTSSELTLAGGGGFQPTSGSTPPTFTWEATPKRSGVADLRFAACTTGQPSGGCPAQQYEVEVTGRTYGSKVRTLVTGHLIQLFPSVSIFEVGRFFVRVKRRRKKVLPIED